MYGKEISTEDNSRLVYVGFVDASKAGAAKAAVGVVQRGDLGEVLAHWDYFSAEEIAVLTKLSKKELLAVIDGIVEGNQAYKEALAQGATEDQANMFQHCVASCVTGSKIGSKKTKALSDAHEGPSRNKFPRDLVNSILDQIANAAGRACGEQYASCKKGKPGLSRGDHCRSCCMPMIQGEDEEGCDDNIGGPPPPH